WSRRVHLSVCTVYNWALDFEGNLQRILTTCEDANRCGPRLLLGPELEIPGYGCAYHFFKLDMAIHSWEILKGIVREILGSLVDLFQRPVLLIVTRMPVRQRILLYNYVLAVLNGYVI
ncbi:hypothetical protein Angca_005993, partial [Angiostrongylus cantonensis]